MPKLRFWSKGPPDTLLGAPPQMNQLAITPTSRIFAASDRGSRRLVIHPSVERQVQLSSQAWYGNLSSFGWQARCGKLMFRNTSPQDDDIWIRASSATACRSPGEISSRFWCAQEHDAKPIRHGLDPERCEKLLLVPVRIRTSNSVVGFRHEPRASLLVKEAAPMEHVSERDNRRRPTRCQSCAVTDTMVH